MELFEEMMEAKAFKNRVEERHEMWRAQNAATTIQVSATKWEERKNRAVAAKSPSQ